MKSRLSQKITYAKSKLRILSIALFIASIGSQAGYAQADDWQFVADSKKQSVFVKPSSAKIATDSKGDRHGEILVAISIKGEKHPGIYKAAVDRSECEHSYGIYYLSPVADDSVKVPVSFDLSKKDLGREIIKAICGETWGIQN